MAAGRRSEFRTASVPTTMMRMPPKTKAGARGMNKSGDGVTSITYPAKRKNIPPAGLEAHGVVREAPALTAYRAA